MARTIQNIEKGLREIFFSEGRRRPLQTKITNSSPISGSGIELGSITPQMGFFNYVKKIHLSISKKADVEITIGNISGTQPENSFSFKIRNVFERGSHTIDIEDIVYSGSLSSVPLRVVLYEVYNDDDTVSTDKSFMSYCQIQAYEIYEDFDYNNPTAKQCIWIGDSVMRGTPSGTAKDKHYIWQTKIELRKKGIQTRMCSRALGGSTSVKHNEYIQKGLYDTSEWDYIFYNLGVNDTDNSTYVSDYTNSVRNAILWKKQRFPNSKLIVFGPHKSSIPSKELKYADIRTIAETEVLASGDSSILYCNLGVVDLPNISGAYYTADGAGVHLTDVGYSALWTQVIQPFVNTKL